MPKSIFLIVSLLLGAGAGLIAGRISSNWKPNQRQRLKYFVVSSTAPGSIPDNVYRRTGPIPESGSQTISLLDGTVDLKIYHIAAGSKSLLHEVEIDHACFPTINFTLQPTSQGVNTLTMLSQSVMSSSKNDADIYPKEWRYHFGDVKSIQPLNTPRSPSFETMPQMEVPVLRYKFCRTHEDWNHNDRGAMGKPSMSEEAMIGASKSEPDLEFLLITLKFRKE